MPGFIDGFFDALKAFGYLTQNRLWRYCILPALCALVCTYFLYSWFSDMSDGMTSWMIAKYPWEWGRDAVDGLTGFIGKAISFVGSLFLLKYVVLIISSPFMSLLSEKVERLEYGDQEVPWSLSTLISDFVRGIRISLRNILRELFYVLLLMIAGLFPVIGIFSVALTFLVQAFYAGFGSIDYMLERHYDIRNSVQFVKQRRAYAAGLGTVFLLLSMTGVGVLFAAPLTTVAATRRLASEV